MKDIIMNANTQPKQLEANKIMTKRRRGTKGKSHKRKWIQRELQAKEDNKENTSKKKESNLKYRQYRKLRKPCRKVRRTDPLSTDPLKLDLK